jgi:hypothetical protein
MGSVSTCFKAANSAVQEQQIADIFFWILMTIYLLVHSPIMYNSTLRLMQSVEN